VGARRFELLIFRTAGRMGLGYLVLCMQSIIPPSQEAGPLHFQAASNTSTFKALASSWANFPGQL